jgi:hypothetical protein
MPHVRSPERTRLMLERAALALAALCFVLVFALNGRPYFTTSSFPPRGIMDPHVALQMVRSVREVDALLGDAPSADREVMRVKQYIDFAFILAYAALFIVVGIALLRVSRWALAIGFFGVMAALHDVMENRDILQIVDIPLSAVTAPMISHLHLMSVIKWMSAAIAMGLLGVFTLSARRWYFRLIGAVDLFAAAIILWGVVDNRMLVWAGMPLAAGMIANAATLKFLSAELTPSESAKT